MCQWVGKYINQEQRFMIWTWLRLGTLSFGEAIYFFPYKNWTLNVWGRRSDLRSSAVLWGFSGWAESSSTSESCRPLLLGSSCVVLEDWEIKSAASASQLLSDRFLSLQLKKSEWWRKSMTVFLFLYLHFGLFRLHKKDQTDQNIVS